MRKKDPFRSAEKWTACPRCNDVLGWNTEDRLTGQTCGTCGYVFRGREKACKGPYPARQAVHK